MSKMDEQVEGPDDARLTVLQTLLNVLRSESELISLHPETTWQQVYNSLQGKGGSISQLLGAWLDERYGSSTTPPWLRLLRPLRSDSPALVGRFLHVLPSEHQWTDDCAISFDGTLVASTSLGTLYVWNRLTGQLLYDGTPGGGLCAFSTDDSWLYTVRHELVEHENAAILQSQEEKADHQAERDEAPPRDFYFDLIIRDTKTLGQYQVLSTRRDYYDQIGRALAVSPDGMHLMTTLDYKLVLWNIVTRKVVLLKVEHRDLIHGCVFSSDNTYFVSADERELIVWDTSTWQIIRRWNASRLTSTVKALATIPKSHWIATAHSDGTLLIWDARTGQRVVDPMIHQRSREYSTMSPGLLDCAASPDGTLLASVGRDKTLKLWHVQTGQHLATYIGHSEMISSCAFSGNGAYIVSSDWDGQVLVWDASVRPREDVSLLSVHTEAIQTCSVSPDSAFVVTGSKDKTLIWEIESGKIRFTTRLNGITACAISPDCKYIVLGDEVGGIRILDTRNGEEVYNLWCRHSIKDCAISPDSSWFVCAHYEQCTCWKASDGEEGPEFEGHESEVVCCAISPDGTWLVSGSEPGEIRVWDTLTGKHLQTLETKRGGLRHCAFSPDGTFLVAATSNQWGYHWEHPITVWDTTTALWTERLTIPFKSEPVVACHVTPDGMYIVVATKDGSIYVWDAETGKQCAVFVAPTQLTCLALHPWKAFAVGGGLGGTLAQVELMGLTYGPIVVTAKLREDGNVVRCPVCQQEMRISTAQLGQVSTCLQPGCSSWLRVNKFEIKSVRPPAWQS